MINPVAPRAQVRKRRRRRRKKKKKCFLKRERERDAGMFRLLPAGAEMAFGEFNLKKIPYYLSTQK